MSEHPLGLQDEEFWTDPFKNQGAVFDETVSELKSALIIDGPAVVELGRRDSIPVPVLYSASLKDALTLPLQKAAILTAVRLEDRDVLVGFAVDRSRPRPSTPQGAALDEDTFVGDTVLTDLRARLGIDKPGTYLVTVLLRDRVSNRVRISVSPSSSTYVDVEVEKVLRGLAPPPKPISPAPGAPVPSYDQLPNSPPIPEQPGIALAAERVFLEQPGAQAIVAGSFRVKALPRELSRRPEPGAEPTPGQRLPTAIVPLRLVVLTSDSADYGPYLLSISAPSYDPVPEDASNPEVTGYFAVDLFSLAGLKPGPFTCFVYAFLGEWMAGPTAVGVVTREMIPR